jgi:large subunit ribosomal protein L17
MNKKVFGRKLSRSRPAREALFASLAQSLIKNGKIVTTRAKAKAVQGNLEKMLTLAKTGSLSARRKVMSKLDNAREASDILFQNVAKAIPTKNSGFTRIISLPNRTGDNAQMVRIEWTEKVEYESKKKPEVKVKGKKVEEKPKKTVKKVVKTAKK